MRKAIFWAVLLLVAVFAFPTHTQANVPVPIIALLYPPLIVLLVPIIFVETLVFERKIHLGFWKSSWRLALANGVSTIVGYPVIWILWLLVGMLSNEAFDAWHLQPFWRDLVNATVGGSLIGDIEGQAGWVQPLALAFGLLLGFLASVGIEGPILKRLFKRPWDETWALTWKANILSYLFLIGIVAIFTMIFRRTL